MNIAEILKYCPKGTKLYSTAFGEVEFINITPSTKLIIVQDIYNTHLTFYSGGSYTSSGECILFPSKDQRDWSKFRLPVKRGDIMMEINGDYPFIVSGICTKDDFPRPKAICGMNKAGEIIIRNNKQWTSDFYIPASEEVKKKLFDKITEAGYKWNADTLELEEIEPTFKEGDVIVDDQDNICLIEKINSYTDVIVNAVLHHNNVFTIYSSTTVNRPINKCRLASAKEISQLLEMLYKNNYTLINGKLTQVKKLKPFDKVLVKNSLNKKWSINLFSYYDKDNKDFPFVCINGSYPYCIPYNEHTAHLLGATDPYTKVGSITSC